MSTPARRRSPAPSLPGKPSRQRLSTTGFLTPGLVALLCLALLLAAYESGRGHYRRLRSRVVSDPAEVGPAGPGGQAPLELRRTPSGAPSQPELVSATLLPGRGMQVLQITAIVPGRGEVPLLFSPDLAEVSQVLTASGRDAYGAVSSTFGGAIEVPWAGRLSGLPSANPNVLQSVWQGQRLTFPAGAENSTLSTEGLLLNRATDSLESSSIAGGKAATAVFHAGSFAGSWPSSLEVTVQADLSSYDFTLSITVKNTGQAASPAGIGWHPHFALNGQRSGVLLTVPSTMRTQIDARTGLSTGGAVSVAGSALDFSSLRGTRLGEASLNETFVNLQRGPLADGPAAELRVPASGYGLRLTPLSPGIRNLTVAAPAGQAWISLSPSTNLDNALSHEVSAATDDGLTTLQPGDSLQWRTRLEIVPPR